MLHVDKWSMFHNNVFVSATWHHQCLFVSSQAGQNTELVELVQIVHLFSRKTQSDGTFFNSKVDQTQLEDILLISPSYSYTRPPVVSKILFSPSCQNYENYRNANREIMEQGIFYIFLIWFKDRIASWCPGAVQESTRVKGGTVRFRETKLYSMTLKIRTRKPQINPGWCVVLNCRISIG